MKTAYVDALKAVALGQSYSISGRSLQRADLAEIKDTIREITAAQANANGTRVTSTLVNFSHATR